MPASVLEDAAAGAPLKAIAKNAGTPVEATREYLARHAAELGNLRDVKTPELMGAFHDLAFRAFAKTLEGDSTMGDLRNASITMGVATDKLQLLSGQPTAIVAGIHEHRVDLAAIAERLAAVQRRLPAEKIEDAEFAPVP